MRFFNRPASGTASGSTFSASERLPVGASHSSHASPSTINPNRLATAIARVQATGEGRVEDSFIAGIIASDGFPDDPQAFMAGAGDACTADTAELALARHAANPAAALSRRPA